MAVTAVTYEHFELTASLDGAEKYPVILKLWGRP
jgi:hypothetical protein